MNHVKVRNTEFNNGSYNPGSRLLVFIWYFFNLLFIQNAYNPLSKLKVFILKLFGAKIGRGVIIKPSVNIKYPWFLEIGDHTWIGENVWIDNLTSVKIGSNVCISQGAMLLTGNHNYKKTSFDLITKKIIIEDGAWVGAQSVVCPGVTCNSHSILTVGSVATKDLEPYMIYQGNPATKIRERKMETVS